MFCIEINVRVWHEIKLCTVTLTTASKSDTPTFVETMPTFLLQACLTAEILSETPLFTPSNRLI